MRETPGVNLSGFLRSEKGGGQSVRATALALNAAGIPYCLNDFQEPGSLNRETPVGPIEAANPFPVNVCQGDPFGFAVFLEQRGEEYFRGKYNIAFWNWEQEEFPRRLLPALKHFDEVWAPSRFTQEALARVALVPVVRVPLAVVSEPASAAPTRGELGIAKDAFVFLTVFDYASGIERKNPLGLLRAFKLAFGSRPDVVLLLKTSRAELYPQAAARVRAEVGAAANIRAYDATTSRSEVAALMDLSDAYVSLHRSEGFGFPPAEAMLRGKPAVATAYSATTDFMDVGNSFPVAYDLAPLGIDDGPYAKGCRWAEPSVAHAAEQMRALEADRARSAAIATRGAATIAADFSPAAVGALIRRRLETIGSRLGERVA